MTTIFYLFIALIVSISFIKSRQKTYKALKIAGKKLLNILPSLIMMVIAVSIILYLIPDKLISDFLGADNKFVGLFLGAMIGSITLMPGFIAFPLAGILLSKGVLYMVLSAFTTTLMMVGILTYPIEKEYFGVKVTLIRNSLSFAIAIVVALVTGFCFGELF